MRFTLVLCFNAVLSILTYGQTCLSGGITINSQLQIDDFASDYPGCMTIDGNVIINDATPNVITNLNGLSQLTSIAGDLFISSNPSLINLNGLENLTSITGLFIVQNNVVLSDLFLSANLIAVGPLDIRNNASLSDLGGLENLQSVGGYLRLWNNAILPDINELSSINSLGFYLEIKNNNLLTDISGLQNLTSINGWIEVADNPLLTSLNGLESINPFSINNPISSLPDIEITNNTMLSVCNVLSICDALSLPSTITDIQNNATGCNSEAEVDAACSGLPVEWDSPLKASLEEEAISLQWSVSNQMDNDYFQIEKSKNGLHFYSIDRIVGERNFLPSKTYRFLDTNPLVGINYYRIAQYDENGSYSYSNIASARIEKSEVLVYPNPTTSRLEISTNVMGKILIADCYGRRLNTYFKTDKHLLIYTHHLPNGLYYIKFENGDYLSFTILR